jgi:hypothetical protein
VEVQGYFPLGRIVSRGISSIDLLKDVRTFTGDSLVVQVSRSDAPRPDLVRLVERFNRVGGTSVLETVVDPQAPLFGQQRYRSTASGKKRDTQLALSDAILAATWSWLGEARSPRVVAS